MNDQINVNEDENPSNSIAALRNILFGQLRELNDPEKKIDLERVTAINDLSQTIINSAKVEVEALKIIGGTGTGFIPVRNVKTLPSR